MVIKKKKKEGTLLFGDAIMFGIFLFVVVIFLGTFSAFYTNYNRSQNIKHLVREYVERMETVGYLTSSDRTELIDRLNAYGVNNPQIESDTTTAYVGYGNQIVLHVTGSMNKRTFRYDGSGFSASAVTEEDSNARTIPIDIYKTSTCKMITQNAVSPP